MADELNDINEGIASLDRKLEGVMEYLHSTQKKEEKDSRKNKIFDFLTDQEEESNRLKSTFSRYERKKKVFQAMPVTIDGITPESRRDLTKIFKGMLPVAEKIKESEFKPKINWLEILKWGAILAGILGVLGIIAKAGDEILGVLKSLKEVIGRFIPDISKADTGKIPKPNAKAVAAANQEADEILKLAEKLKAAKPGLSITDDVIKDLIALEKALSKYNKVAAQLAASGKSTDELKNAFEKVSKASQSLDDIIKENEMILEKYNKMAPESAKNNFLKNLFEIANPESASNKQIAAIIKDLKLTPNEAKAYADLIKTRYVESLSAAAKYGFGPDSDVFKKLVKTSNLSPQEIELLQKSLTNIYGSIIKAGMDTESPLVKALAEGKLSQQQIDLVVKSVGELNSRLLMSSLEAQKKIILDMVEKGYKPSDELLKTLNSGDDLLVRLATQRYVSLINAGLDPNSPVFLKMLEDVKLGEPEAVKIQARVKSLSMDMLNKSTDELKKLIDMYSKNALGKDLAKELEEVVRLKNLGLTPDEIKNLKPVYQQAYIANRSSFLNEVLTALKEAPEKIWSGFKDIVKNDILTPEEYAKLTTPAKSIYQKFFAGLFGSAETVKAVEETAEVAAREASKAAIKTPTFMQDLRTALQSTAGRWAMRILTALGVGISAYENLTWLNNEVEKIKKDNTIANPDEETKKKFITAYSTMFTQIAGWFSKSVWGVIATFLKAEDFEKSIDVLLKSIKADANDPNSFFDTNTATAITGLVGDIVVKASGRAFLLISDMINWAVQKLTLNNEFLGTWYEEFRKDFIERIKKFSIGDWLINLLGLNKYPKSANPDQNAANALNNSSEKSTGKSVNSTVQADFVYRPGMPPVPFSPDDTIIGVKELRTLVEPMERSFEYYDKALKTWSKITEESNKKLLAEIREEKRTMTAMADSLKALSHTLSQNSNLNMINNSKSMTNITIAPTTSKSYRDSRYMS